MPHFMVDLETLGSRPDAAILSIGAVAFDWRENRLLDSFYVVVDLQSALDHGGRIEADTLYWWLKQSAQARASVFEGGALARLTFPATLANFAAFLSHVAPDIERRRIWGNGSDFDNVILAEAYHRLGVSVPWPYRGNRCFRTLKGLAIEADKPPANSIKHHALKDAEHQALHAMAILRRLNGL